MDARSERDEQELADAMSAEAQAFGARFADYNIIAAYSDMNAAKRAIDALELAGIESQEYALLGATAAAAESRVDNDALHDTDAGMTDDIFWHSMGWAAAGIAIGAIVGLLLPIVPGWPLNVAYSIMLAVITLGTLGALVGAMSHLDAGENVDATYRPSGNHHVLLGVISQDPLRVQRAENVLNHGNPLTLHRYDRRGELRA
jgi:hypothetical protein